MGIRVGVIGVRLGTRVHMPAYKAEGLEVVAVCALHQDRARQAAERFQIPHAFTDHRQMLRMKGLDAVAVAAPRPFHYALSKDSLDAGKHVICEKPFTTQIEHAYDLHKTAEANGLTAMVAHKVRFTPIYARVKELIDEDYLGRRRMCTVTQLTDSPSSTDAQEYVSDDDDIDMGGGMVSNRATDYLDCLLDWFGDVKSVWGRTRTFVPDRIDPETGKPRAATADDCLVASLEMANGGWAQFIVSSVMPFSHTRHLEIYGESGALVIPTEPWGRMRADGKLAGAHVGDKRLHSLPVPKRLGPVVNEQASQLPATRLLCTSVRGRDRERSVALAQLPGRLPRHASRECHT